MTPTFDDPFFRALIYSYRRAGIRSIPVESTHERDVLDAHEFDIPCDLHIYHENGKFGHGTTGDNATHYLKAPCGYDAYMCTGVHEWMQARANERSWCGNHTHLNREITFTPLPEGNR